MLWTDFIPLVFLIGFYALLAWLAWDAWKYVKKHAGKVLVNNPLWILLNSWGAYVLVFVVGLVLVIGGIAGKSWGAFTLGILMCCASIGRAYMKKFSHAEQ